jgi:hypothetical protein
MAVLSNATSYDIAMIQLINIQRAEGSWFNADADGAVSIKFTAASCPGGSAMILLRNPATIIISSIVQGGSGAAAVKVSFTGPVSPCTIDARGRVAHECASGGDMVLNTATTKGGVADRVQHGSEPLEERLQRSYRLGRCPTCSRELVGPFRHAVCADRAGLRCAPSARARRWLGFSTDR